LECLTCRHSTVVTGWIVWQPNLSSLFHQWQRRQSLHFNGSEFLGSDEGKENSVFQSSRAQRILRGKRANPAPIMRIGVRLACINQSITDFSKRRECSSLA